MTLDVLFKKNLTTAFQNKTIWDQNWVAYKFTLAGHTWPIPLLVCLMVFAVVFCHFGTLLLHSLSLQLLLLLSVHLFKALSDPCR